MSDLLRKGRLGKIRKDVLEFTSSVDSDTEIIEPTLNINRAHIVMLIEERIITAPTTTQIHFNFYFYFYFSFSTHISNIFIIKREMSRKTRIE